MTNRISDEVMKFVDGKTSVTIPQLQTELKLDYAAASDMVEELLKSGALKFKDGLEYEVVPKSKRKEVDKPREKDPVPDSEKPDKIDYILRRLMEFDARYEADFNRKSEKKDEEAEFMRRYVQALELAFETAKLDTPFTIPLIQRCLGFNFQIAARIHDRMREDGYLVSVSPGKSEVKISEATIKKLKKKYGC